MEEEKKEMVIPDNVKFKKEGAFHKLLSSFIQVDGKTIGEHFLKNILYPSLREMGLSLAEYICYPDRADRPRRRAGIDTDYHRISNRGRSDIRSYNERDNDVEYNTASERKFRYDDFYFTSIDAAYDAINNIKDHFNYYNNKTLDIITYFRLCGIDNAGDYTDNNWGWSDIPDNISPVRIGHNKYMIPMPKPRAIVR